MGIESVKKADGARTEVIDGSTVIRMDAQTADMTIELLSNPDH